MNFIKPQDSDLSPSSVMSDERFDDGGDLLLLAARESRGGFEADASCRLDLSRVSWFR